MVSKGKGMLNMNAIVFGIVIYLVLLCVLTAVTAILIWVEYIPVEYARYLILLVQVVALYISASYVRKRYEERCHLALILYCVGVVASLAGLNLAVFKGKFEGIGSTILIICGITLASVLLRNRKNGNSSEKIVKLYKRQIVGK